MNPSKKNVHLRSSCPRIQNEHQIFENSSIIKPNLDQDLCKEKGLRQIRPKIDPYLENMAYIHVCV
jgi:hypothetical protein